MPEFMRSSAVPHLEVRRSCLENSCYRPHTHDAFSIGVIDQGSAVFAGALHGQVMLFPDDVILIPAQQVHQCNPASGPWEYHMAHMDQEWARSIVPDTPAHKLFDTIVVVRDAPLASALRDWVDQVFAGADALELENGLRAALFALDPSSTEHYAPPLRSADDLARLSLVFERLAEFEAPCSLDELGKLVGMSRFQVVRAVKEATGLSPMAWRQNTRISRARELLREGNDIAETAVHLGFSDQSHFHRIFRAHVAASPGGYRS